MRKLTVTMTIIVTDEYYNGKKCKEFINWANTGEANAELKKDMNGDGVVKTSFDLEDVVYNEKTN